MLDRRALLASLAAIAIAVPALADGKAFKSADFDKAKASGKPVLVEVSAPWCPTCKAQKPILSELKAQPRFKDLASFEVDFEQPEGRAATAQRAAAEHAHRLQGWQGGPRASTGETSKAAIEGLLAKAL